MGWRERWQRCKHNTSNFSLVTHFVYSFLPSSSSATTARTEFFPVFRFGSPNICHVNESHNQFHTKRTHTVARTRNAHANFGLETPLMSHFHPLVLYRVHKENNHKYKYISPVRRLLLPPPLCRAHCDIVGGSIFCAISLTHPVPIAQFHFIIIQPLSNVSAHWLNFFVRSLGSFKPGASSHILKYRTDVYVQWFICFITAPRIHIIELLYIL